MKVSSLFCIIILILACFATVIEVNCAGSSSAAAKSKAASSSSKKHAKDDDDDDGKFFICSLISQFTLDFFGSKMI